MPLANVTVKECTVSEPFDRDQRDTSVKQLERIQRQADQVAQVFPELRQKWSVIRNMLSTFRSKARLKTQLHSQVEEQLQTVAKLVFELQEISLPVNETNLIGFRNMTSRQLTLLAQQLNTLKIAMDGKRKLRRRSNVKSIKLDTIEELDENVEFRSASKRFDPNRPQVIDSDALMKLFGYTSETEEMIESDTESLGEFIEISEGREVKIVTTRQTNREPCSESTDRTSESINQAKMDTTTPGDEHKTTEHHETTEELNNVMQPYTTSDLMKAQGSDDDLSLILYFLKNNVEPAQSDVAISSPAAKKLLINKEFYYLDDNGILHNVSKNGVQRWVVPRKYREEVMSLNHDLVCTGHQGVQRTRERIKGRYFWYRIHSDVRVRKIM